MARHEEAACYRHPHGKASGVHMSGLVDFGIITIATGSAAFHDMARALARSLEHAGVRLPRAVVVDTNDTGLEAFFHHVIVTDALPRHFQSKLHLGGLTPFVRSVFLDVDCLVYEQFHAYLDQALRSPLCAPGELVPDRDWFGISSALVGELAGSPRSYQLLHSGLFAFEREVGGALLESALRLEPAIVERFGVKPPVSADILLSLSAAIAQHTDHWPKDPAFISPSLRWTRAPRLDVARRSAVTFPNGRATSSRIVHFMGEHKSGRTYARERARLADLVPRCDLRVTTQPATWHAGAPALSPDYHIWSVRDGAHDARELGEAVLRRVRRLATR